MSYYHPKQTGLRIKTLRKQMGLTQEAFSERLYTTRSHIAKLELGDRTPSLELLVDISNLTGASLDYLILGKTGTGDHLKAETMALIQALEHWMQIME